jgi:type II secretory pathway predicted ATPase ExeA
LALFYPCDEPFRKSAGKLNRALRRKEEQEVRARTMANLVEREGEQIAAYLEKKAESILEDHGFNSNGSIKN